MAVLLRCASDQTTYCNMQYDYKMDYANKKDNYPKLVADMVDVMKQFKVKTTSKKKVSPSDQYKSMGRRTFKLSPRNVLHKADKLFVMSASSQTTFLAIAR